MERLFGEHKFEQKLPSCTTVPIPVPHDPYHETFCCKKEISRYIDENDEEIAIIAVYTRKDLSVQRVISKLRIGGEVYNQRLL